MIKLPAFRNLILPVLICATPARFLCLTGFAQSVEGISNARDRQRDRRPIPRGEEALARGKVAMQEKNYHPGARRVSHGGGLFARRGSFRESARRSGERLLQERREVGRGERIAEGKYAEAESIVREILADQLRSELSRSAELLAHLQTPGYFNSTMGPKFIAKVEEVKQLLTDADGYYAIGPLRSRLQEIRAGSRFRSLQHGRAPRRREDR